MQLCCIFRLKTLEKWFFILVLQSRYSACFTCFLALHQVVQQPVDVSGVLKQRNIENMQDSVPVEPGLRTIVLESFCLLLVLNKNHLIALTFRIQWQIIIITLMVVLRKKSITEKETHYAFYNFRLVLYVKLLSLKYLCTNLITRLQLEISQWLNLV